MNWLSFKPCKLSGMILHYEPGYRQGVANARLTLRGKELPWKL
jgi:hypothetical protein